MESQKFEDFRKDIVRQENVEKAIIKSSKYFNKEIRHKMRERLDRERHSFSSQSERNQSDRREFVKKIEEKHKKIDICNDQHEKSIELLKSTYQEINMKRTNDNIKGKEVEK